MEKVDFAKPAFGPEEEDAVTRVLRSGWVVGGPNLAEFEKRCAIQSGASEGIGVSSWTTGAFLVLKALGVGPGDEVIVPSLTFIASVNVIRHVGATPVFADIDPRTFNIDPNDIRKKITARTKVILPVDQIGMPCEIDQILKIAAQYDLFVIHDAACSMGSSFRDSPIGSFALATIFSLHARKLITTGEGGMIVTDDTDLAAQLRVLRHQGMSVSDYSRHGKSPTVVESYGEIGYNFRITDIQAAIGLCQLDRLQQYIHQRRLIAKRYIDVLSNNPFIEPPYVPEYACPNWQSFQVRIKPNGPLSRNELMDQLFHLNIQTRRGVMASHLELPYKGSDTELPETEKAASECMLLPIYSTMELHQADLVLGALNQLYDHLSEETHGKCPK